MRKKTIRQRALTNAQKDILRARIDQREMKRGGAGVSKRVHEI